MSANLKEEPLTIEPEPASTPTPAPAPEVTPSPSPAPAALEPNWVELSADEPDSPEPEVTPEPTPTPKAPEPAPATPPPATPVAPAVAKAPTPTQVTPPAPQPPAVQPAPTVAPTPPATTPPAAVAPVAPTPVQPQVVEPPAQPPIDYAAQREEQLARFEKHYEMSEDEGMELIRAPQEVLPKMLARIQVDAIEAALSGLTAILPNLVVQQMNQREQGMQLRKAFYDKWPRLERPEYYPGLQAMIGGYLQANPRATDEDLINQVGAAAMMSYGLAAGDAPPNPPPEAPPVRPFVPATPGGGGAPVVVQKKTEWEELDDTFKEDE